MICSSLDAFIEVAGPVPHYLDPIDGLGWARMIEEYARPDSQLRQSQIRRLDAVTVPRWSDHFEVIDQIIDSVGAAPPVEAIGRKSVRDFETDKPRLSAEYN